MNNPPTWRKSSYSVDNNCVELAGADGGISVRDSKDTAGAVLHFTRDEMLAFIRGTKSGEFDDLVS